MNIFNYLVVGYALGRLITLARFYEYAKKWEFALPVFLLVLSVIYILIH